MHITRRAPELSATSRLDCIWIIDQTPSGASSLGGVLRQDLPGLQLGFRRALDDAGDVAFLVGIGFVVRVVLLGAADGLLQQRVQEGALHAHHHGLVPLVGDHHALENSFRHLRSNPQAAAGCLARSTVLMRAMSLRTSFTRWVFSSWPVAAWKRRLNCSFFRLSRLSFSWSAVIPRISSMVMTLNPRAPRRRRAG